MLCLLDEIYSFFTSWVITLNMIFYLGYLKEFQYSILYLTLLLPFIGTAMVHIYPKKLELNLCGQKYVVREQIYKVYNVIGHILPAILLYIHYDHKIPQDNLMFMMGIIIVYLLFNNPFKIYGLACDSSSKKCKSVVRFLFLYFFTLLYIAFFVTKK